MKSAKFIGDAVYRSIAAPGTQQNQMQNYIGNNTELGKKCVVSEDYFSSFKSLHSTACLNRGRKTQFMQMLFKEKMLALCVSFFFLATAFFKKKHLISYKSYKIDNTCFCREKPFRLLDWFSYTVYLLF